MSNAREIALSLQRLLSVMAARDTARGDCDSSWGYHGSHYDTDVENAEHQLEVDLNEYIDARLAARAEGTP